MASAKGEKKRKSRGNNKGNAAHRGQEGDSRKKRRTRKRKRKAKKSRQKVKDITACHNEDVCRCNTLPVLPPSLTSLTGSSTFGVHPSDPALTLADSHPHTSS